MTQECTAYDEGVLKAWLSRALCLKTTAECHMEIFEHLSVWSMFHRLSSQCPILCNPLVPGLLLDGHLEGSWSWWDFSPASRSAKSGKGTLAGGMGGGGGGPRIRSLGLALRMKGSRKAPGGGDLKGRAFSCTHGMISLISSPGTHAKMACRIKC